MTSFCVNTEIIKKAFVYQCNGQKMMTRNRCHMLHLASDTV